MFHQLVFCFQCFFEAKICLVVYIFSLGIAMSLAAVAQVVERIEQSWWFDPV